MTNREFLLKLKALNDKLTDKFTQECFYAICLQYTKFLQQKEPTKNCTKTQIMDRLISHGLMSMRYDKEKDTYEYPDDRKVRLIVRRLMRSGYPILSCSNCAGYYICDSTKEINVPYNQDKQRALKLLAMQKSYEKMSGFVTGQLDIDDIELVNNEDDCE